MTHQEQQGTTDQGLTVTRTNMVQLRSGAIRLAIRVVDGAIYAGCTSGIGCKWMDLNEVVAVVDAGCNCVDCR